MDKIEFIERIHKLKESGALTDSEFEYEKRNILSEKCQAISSKYNIISGNNHKYYQNLFENIDESKNSSKIYWNWSAFIFGIMWLSYRKMNYEAFVSSVIVLIIFVFCKIFELGNVWIESIAIMHFIIGIKGSYIYKNNLDKIIKSNSFENYKYISYFLPFLYFISIFSALIIATYIFDNSYRSYLGLSPIWPVKGSGNAYKTTKNISELSENKMFPCDGRYLNTEIGYSVELSNGGRVVSMKFSDFSPKQNTVNSNVSNGISEFFDNVSDENMWKIECKGDYVHVSYLDSSAVHNLGDAIKSEEPLVYSGD